MSNKKPNVFPLPMSLSGEAHVIREALYRANILPNGQRNPMWETEFEYWKAVYMQRFVNAEGEIL